MKRLTSVLVFVLLMACWPAQAEEIDDQYLRIIRLADQADTFKTSGRKEAALAKYKEALRALQTFQKANPRWNMNAVSFRLNDFTQNIAALSPTNSGPAISPQTASDSQVKLLEAGGEPRKVLRLKPKPGDEQTLVMTMKMGMNMKLADLGDQQMKLPTMELSMSTKVKEVASNGDINYEIQFLDGSIAEDPEVLPQISEPVKATLASIKGLSGTGTLSSRGISKKFDVKLADDADPQLKHTFEQMKQSFSNFSAPLPSEAVGVGAKWEFKMSFESQGMKINQTVIYELTSMEGERLTAKSTVTQSAPKQKVQNPAMPSLKLDLSKMEGQGKGELTIDLSKIVVLEGTAEVHSDVDLAMDTGGDQKQTMTMKVDLNLSMKSK